MGPYHVEAMIGEGAMGVVFRARHMENLSLVALKVVRKQFAHDDRYRQRFLQEAKAASEVKHPHLVDVLDAGEVNGRQYLAMRYVDGHQLEERLKDDGPLPVADVIRLATEIGGAVDALHAVGLIHRDIKTSNVLLDRNGAAALTDFGLAKGQTGYADMTAPRQILGTMEYLAPERIRGELAATSTDIYALGCLVYECVTGATPFGGMGAMKIAFAHLEQDPANPADAQPELTPEFGVAVNTALAKEPSERPSSATAYADLLRAASPG